MSGLHHAELRPRSLRYCTRKDRKDCAEIRRDDRASYRFKLDTKRRIHLRVAVGRCPLWVKSGHMQCKSTCPLYPRKRT